MFTDISLPVVACKLPLAKSELRDSRGDDDWRTRERAYSVYKVSSDVNMDVWLSSLDLHVGRLEDAVTDFDWSGFTTGSDLFFTMELLPSRCCLLSDVIS